MKVLVDTSVWISHLRKPVSELVDLLAERQVVTHDAVIGELACGTFKKRHEVLGNLKILPRIPSPDFLETLTFLEEHRLFGKGLSWIDINLLASATLAGVSILSFDKALMAVARNGVKA